MMVRRKASDEGDPSSLDQDKHNSTTVMLEEERHARPTVSLGLSTWEAVLNELLELRNSDLIKSTTTAYNLLQSVEETVLPTWKEEGRSLLSAAGLDHGQLRKTGMREETIEKLYLGLYAFSFGFGTIARQAIEGVREKEHRRELVLQISQVFSTLTGEALDAENHDLISEMMEEKDRRIADLDREKTILDRRVKTVNEEIAFAHHMSNKAHAERIAAAAKAEAEISEQLMTIRQLEQAVAGLSSRVRELEEETGVLRGDLERLEGENKEMSEEREQTRSKHLSEKKALTSELYAARNEAQTASKSLHDLSVRHATLSRVNGKIDEELKSVRLQLEEEGKEKEELLMERTRALETITHLEQEAARQAALQQQELDRLRAEKERTEKLMNEMIDRLKLTGKEAEEEVLRLSTSVRKMEEEVEERKKKEAELSEELDMVCANVAVLRNSLRSEEEERKRWKQEAEDKAGALKGLQEEHKNLQRAHRRKEEEAEATGKALSLARKEAAKLEEERRRATEELAREIVQHEVSRVDGAMKLESSHSSRMLLVRNTLQRTSEQRASRMMSFFSFHLQNKEEGEGGEGREGEAERKGGLVSGLEREQKEKEEEKEERAGDKEVSSPIRSPAPSPRADLKGSNNVSFREYLDIRKRAGSSFSLDRGSRGSSAALSSAASSSSSLLHSVKEEESRDLRRVRQTSEEEEEEEEEDGTWEGAGASVLAGAAAGVRGGARAREREGAGARGAARENWLIVVHTLLYRFQVFGHFSMAMKKCLAREEKVRKQLVELQELLRRREEDKADLEKELRKSQFELRLASAGEEKRVEKLSELNEANLALKEEVKKMRRREEELQEKLQEKSADLNAFILKSQKQMDAMREEERIKERRIGELEEELQGLREEKEKTEVRVKYFQQQMSRFADYDLVKERMEALAGEVERLEQERRGREEVIEELREELSSDKNKLHALNLRVQNLILQRDHIQEEARAAQARLQEELDRVTDKVGGLMADKGQLKEPQLHELQRSLREKLGLVLVEDGRIREEFEEAVMRFKEKGVKGLPSSLGISRTESLAAPSKLMRRKEYERALPPAAAAAAASSRHVPYLPEEWNLVEETARKLVEERGRIVGELEDQLGMIPLGNLQLLQEVGELREKLGEARQQLGASRKLMEAHQRTMEKLQLKLINLGGVRSTSDMDKADSESQTRSWEEVVEEEALRLGVSEGRVKELEEERERLREEVKNRSERVANLKREVAIYRRRTEDSWGRVRQELEKEGGPVAPARRNEKLVDRSILDRLKAGSRESKGGETVGEEEVLDAIAEIYNSWYMEKANNCSQDTMLSFLYRHMLQQHKDPEVAEARSKLVLGRVGRLVGVRTTGLRVSFFSSLLNMDQDNLRDTAQHRLVTYMKILSSIPLRCEQEEEEATPPLSSKALLPRVLHFLKSLHSSEICWLSLEEATSFVRSRAKHGRRERIGPLLQELRTHSQREEEAESSWRAGVSVSVDFLLDLLVRHESSSASFSSLRDPFSASPEGGEEEEEGMDPEVFRIGVLRLAFGREFAGTLRSLLEGVKEQLDVSAAWHSYRLISLTVDQARKTIERLLMAPELVREAIRLAEEEEEEKGKAELLSSRGRAEPSNSIGRSVGAWKGDVTRLRARKGSTQAPEEAAAAEVTAAAAAAAAAPPSLTAHGVSPRLLLWKPADKGKSSGISVQMNLALSQEVSSARSKGGLLSARASQSPRPPLTKKPRPQTAVNPAQRR